MREVVLVSPIAAVRTISSFQGKLFRPTAFLFVKVSRHRSCCPSNVKSFMPLYPRILGKRYKLFFCKFQQLHSKSQNEVCEWNCTFFKNLFLVNASILYPFKTLENFSFCPVFRGYKMEALGQKWMKNRVDYVYSPFRNKARKTFSAWCFFPLIPFYIQMS